MRLPQSKIEMAASDEESRYTLRAVKVDKENKRIMATDGHILAIVPCEIGDEDHSTLIGLDSIKNIRAMQKRAKAVPVEVKLNGKVTVTGVCESAEYEVVTGQFPNVDMVVPKVEDRTIVIGLNVNLLLRLAQAMQPEIGKHDPPILELRIKDGNSSVLVKCPKNPDAIGVIMPCRV
jgi:DNA polymerase III sliding clamp (beta) subunit (PCNA family)